MGTKKHLQLKAVATRLCCEWQWWNSLAVKKVKYSIFW